MELVSIILIGISLSMDTFSLSLSISSLLNNTKYLKLFPILVGIFHFLMPFLGRLIGINIIKIFNIANDFLLGIILIILAINLTISLVKDEDITINLSLIGIILLSLSVSMDAFTVGIGLSKNPLVSSTIFSVCSITFTNLGLLIGKYSKTKSTKFSNILGILLLFLLGIYHLF